MRVLTVAELKNNKSDPRKRDYPAEDSLRGKILHRLRSDIGNAVDISDLRNEVGYGLFRHAVNDLVDKYGLDIRCTNPRRNGKRILAGEWFDGQYIDYCAAAFKAGEK